MQKYFKYIEISLLSLILTLLMVKPAVAYVGPGAGLLAIAAFIALAVAVLAALLGFLWFPLKRLLSKKKQAQTTQTEIDEEEKE